jgi:predicted NAD-dependent protein-ADP-ribosyltransferase YbiA (DUF1768 family)
MADKFVFHSRSADAPPGRGRGEKVRNPKDYTELEKIENWRKALSNFHVAPFILDDNEWNSVEHFFHAVKFRNNKIQSENYKYYKTFTVNGDRPWSTNPIFAKQAGKAGRKSIRKGKENTFAGIIDGVKIPTNVNMREDFYTSKVYSRLQKVAFLAKFTQHDDLKRLLLATGDAELWHYAGNRGKPTVPKGKGKPKEDDRKPKEGDGKQTVPKGEGNPTEENGVILFKELMIVRDCIRKFDKTYNLAEPSQFSSDIITEILA